MKTDKNSPDLFTTDSDVYAAKLRRAFAELEGRFWSKVGRGSPDECWPWQGANNGYRIRNGKRWVPDPVKPMEGNPR